jgi:hypothetical protein
VKFSCAKWTDGATRRGRNKMVMSAEKVEARSVIWFLHLQGKFAREIHDQMTAVYQEGVPSYDTVVRWNRNFHCGQTNLEDEPRVEDHLLLRNQELQHRRKQVHNYRSYCS